MAASAIGWDHLDSKAQEHVLSFCDRSASQAIRGTSSGNRQLANRKVKSAAINRCEAGAVQTLRLPLRFPNLLELALSDHWQQDGACFSRAELLQLFGVSECWDKLACLRLVSCRKIDVLALCTILRRTPNLQSLAARLPYSPRAPAAAASAISQLSKLQKLTLHASPQLPAASTAAELVPLSGLPLLSQLSLSDFSWQALRAVAALQKLTSLELFSPKGKHGSELQRLTYLTKLQQLELTTEGKVNCNLLGVVLASMASLRSFTSTDLISEHGSIQEAVPALTAATQLTYLYLSINGSGTCDDLCTTFERCMQMPNLVELTLFALEDDLHTTALAAPAACAGTLRTLDLCLWSFETATLLFSSVAFRSLKLSHLQLSMHPAPDNDPAAEALPPVLIQAICSQTLLEYLNLNVDMEGQGAMQWPDGMWAQIGQQCRQLRNIVLDIGDFMLSGFGCLANLEDLWLTDVDGLEDVDMVHLLPCQMLQSFTCCNCKKLTADAVVALAMAIPKLRRVAAYGCKQLHWNDELAPRPILEVYVSSLFLRVAAPSCTNVTVQGAWLRQLMRRTIYTSYTGR